jgi:proteic killer suppression protein
VIKSFRCKDTERLFRRERVRRFRAIEAGARRKLEMLDAAHGLPDLRLPPGNRLEALAGNRNGRHSIRINDPWRLCFVWKNGDAEDVESVDHHA